MKVAVRRSLKDPESARFSGPFQAARGPDDAVLVCGLVNARNSYGGYTGNSIFIGVFSPQTSDFAVDRIASLGRDFAEAQEVCAAVGITLN